jgi:uncharacterized protein with HEPN domain
MDDRDRQHLELLVGHAEVAISYARAHGRNWWKNPETVDAVLMRITQVGEEARNSSPRALAEVPGIEWREVKGIRSKIIHEYGQVDILIIRGVVARQLPRLNSAVKLALTADSKRRQGAAATEESARDNRETG